MPAQDGSCTDQESVLTRATRCGCWKRTGVSLVALRSMFRSLKRAKELDYRGQSAAACFAYSASAGDLTLVLHDARPCTSGPSRKTSCGRSALARTGRSANRGRAPGRPGRVFVGGRRYRDNRAETATIITAFQERRQLEGWVPASSPRPTMPARLRRDHLRPARRPVPHQGRRVQDRHLR
jgi:hypothetical protein